MLIEKSKFSLLEGLASHEPQVWFKSIGITLCSFVFAFAIISHKNASSGLHAEYLLDLTESDNSVLLLRKKELFCAKNQAFSKIRISKI